MIESFTIFPVPIFRTFFNLKENDRQSLIKKMRAKKLVINYNDSAPIGNFTSFYGGKNILLEQELTEFNSFILNEIQIAHNTTGFKQKVKLLNSWFSIIEKHGFHEPHTHPNSVWSAVFYVNATPQDSPLCFLNKNVIDTGWGLEIAHTQTNFTSNQVSIAPETGLIVIFPSYLLHKVEQQKIDSERIMIAMNFGI